MDDDNRMIQFLTTFLKKVLKTGIFYMTFYINFI